MSERKFQNRKQGEQLREVPHSQKSAISAKQSYESKKEAAKLTTKRHNLMIERDWSKKQADQLWKQAKMYESEGRMDMALETKTEYENEAQRAKRYDLEIDKILKMIDKLYGVGVYSVGLKKGENYAMMKVEQPPSDD